MGSRSFKQKCQISKYWMPLHQKKVGSLWICCFDDVIRVKFAVCAALVCGRIAFQFDAELVCFFVFVSGVLVF